MVRGSVLARAVWQARNHIPDLSSVVELRFEVSCFNFAIPDPQLLEL